MDQISNENIDQSIHFEVNRFSDECMNLYRCVLEKHVNESFDSLSHKIISEIKNNISRTIGGANLFDYSEFEKYNYIYNSQGSTHGSLNIIGTKNYIDNISVDANGKNTINKFFDEMIADEKIVIYGRYFYNVGQVCLLQDYFITSYGKVLSFTNGSTNSITYTDHNFWIPLDYIKILTLVCGGGNLNDRIMVELNTISPKPDWCNKMMEEIKKEKNKKIIGISTRNTNIGMKCELVVEILKFMRDHLYSRKFTPLYIMDIINENNELKEKYSAFDSEKEDFRIQMQQFIEHRDEFTNKNGATLDLIKERSELNELRERLKLASHKLKIEQERLDEERRQFEENMNKFNDMNLDDLIN